MASIREYCEENDYPKSMSNKHLTPYVWDQTGFDICNLIVYANLISTAYNINKNLNIKLSPSCFIDSVDDYSDIINL